MRLKWLLALITTTLSIPLGIEAQQFDARFQQYQVAYWSLSDGISKAKQNKSPDKQICEEFGQTYQKNVRELSEFYSNLISVQTASEAEHGFLDEHLPKKTEAILRGYENLAAQYLPCLSKFLNPPEGLQN